MQRFVNAEREVVTSFATQAEALEVVQLLADRKVDAECVTITRDAESVAETAARRDRLPFALTGAVLGGLLGAAVGLALGVVWPTFAGLALGALVGAAIGGSSTRTDTARTPSRIEIERHDVVTLRDQAPRARAVLEEHGYRVK